jgi:hypothetical protein
VQGGKLVGEHNFLGLNRYKIISTENVPIGTSTLKMDFAYDGGGPARWCDHAIG